ncbi:mannose-1-phosphate guanylyltransferase/mannose-6-phosphate isomerase [Alishewanella tabrizica]|uniref:mannose-1-phosphate guanylyltransferase n=1 Tax=Alishewanella tabrizica TaxID=671278 RepID=A0ABQ2WED2_9ALTE|nr:mannose-1-phosphate guanylyltransferase/mannose-6-phosphate isomerase [Alishewanella tabrizica]GGW48571.1 mannose-1-phosphate guanyltransferase [Alishewanella tabrizica]
MLLPIIMAGGTGSRLWPLSRELMPKQFLTLCGQSTMLQATLERLQGLDAVQPLVICNEDHRFIAAEQLRQINQLQHNIILEPVGRNTAPAIALAALSAQRKGQDPLLLVLAADHVIQDVPAFHQAIATATELAKANKLVTFGIVPTAPETGYGYIRRGTKTTDSTEEHTLSTTAFTVAEFVEKPSKTIAEQYLASGEYYWNSGMFLFKASVYLAKLQHYRPDILAACEQAIDSPEPDLDFIRVNKAAFAACPADSIDYAVMEKTQDAVVVPLDAGWSDVGAWSSLWDISSKDAQNNVLHGDVFQHNSSHNYVYSETGIVTTVGLHNTVIIQTKDAILVAAKDQVQDVKHIVQQLKNSGRTEHHIHREVYRPWGKYDSIDNGHRYQVKRITVKPGEKLSIQMHHHRAEHWIVVHGTAKVTINEQEQLLTENQSVYIPIGAVHSLENPGKIPLELIEVQSGAYLGEDDIVRFSDRYGRN